MLPRGWTTRWPSRLSELRFVPFLFLPSSSSVSSSTDASRPLLLLHLQNVAPATTSEEILKRRDDVVYHCSGILNKPKPRAVVPPKTDTPPAKEEKEPVVEETEEGSATVEDMDAADELD